MPSLLGDMPVGLRVGTFVHEVLEAVDFAATDLDGELTEHVARAQARRRVDVGDEDAVITGLRAVLQTPLGGVLGGDRLCDVGCADRLDELVFELPLAGGDEPTGRLMSGDRRQAGAGEPADHRGGGSHRDSSHRRSWVGVGAGMRSGSHDVPRRPRATGDGLEAQ